MNLYNGYNPHICFKRLFPPKTDKVLKYWSTSIKMAPCYRDNDVLVIIFPDSHREQIVQNRCLLQILLRDKIEAKNWDGRFNNVGGIFVEIWRGFQSTEQIYKNNLIDNAYVVTISKDVKISIGTYRKNQDNATMDLALLLKKDHERVACALV